MTQESPNTKAGFSTAGLPMSARLKLALVTPYPPWRSGVADYARDFAVALAASVDVTVLTYPVLALPREETAENVRILRIWDPRRRFEVLRLFRTMRVLRADIVHIQFGLYGREFGGLVGEPMLLLLALLRLARIPAVVTLHSLWPRGEVRNRIRERTHNRFAAFVGEKFVAGVFRWLARLSVRLLISVASPESSALSAFAAEYGIRAESLSPAVFGVRPAEPMTREAARKGLGLPLDRPLFLVFGFLYEDKGVDVAIQALEQAAGSLNYAQLEIVGPPLEGRGTDYLEFLRRQIARLPDRVVVHIRPEHVPEEEASAYFAAADAVLAPYRRSVGTSAVVNRSLASGRAVIASAPVLQNYIGGGVVEVPPDDPNRLATAMIALIRDPNLRSRLEADAANTAAARPWPLVVADTLKLYRQVSGGGPRSGRNRVA